MTRGMRNGALPLLLGCSVVNPLFSGVDDGASQGDSDGTESSTGKSEAGPGSGAGSDPDSSGEDPSFTTTGGPDSGDGTTTGTDSSFVRCVRLLWASSDDRKVWMVHTTSWARREYGLPAGFATGASALAMTRNSGRLYAFSGDGQTLGYWDFGMSDFGAAALAESSTPGPVVRATSGADSDDIYFMRASGAGLFRLAGDEGEGFTEELVRTTSILPENGGDLAPAPFGNALVAYIESDTVYIVPPGANGSEASMPVVNLYGGAVVTIAGLAGDANTGYYAATAGEMLHLDYDPETEAWSVTEELDYEPIEGTLTDLSPVFLRPAQCVLLQTELGGL